MRRVPTGGGRVREVQAHDGGLENGPRKHCGDALQLARDSRDVRAPGQCDEPEIDVWRLFAPSKSS